MLSHRTSLRLALIVMAVATGRSRADDPVYSGPQAGEKLPSFKVRGVFEPDAGKDLDFVTQAAGKPIVLIFVHDVNRQSIGMTRILSRYTVSRAKDGLATGVVWLADDATEAENTIRRVQHALTQEAPTGVSLDGREGPGSYGLNRKVTLTILVGKESKVTANYALVQPSLQADLPRILESIVAVAGGKAPRLEELEGMPEMRREKAASGAGAGSDADAAAVAGLRDLIRPVIRKDATVEEVDAAGKAVETYVEKNEAARREVGRIATTIVGSGKLANYGTERAQELLKKWARDYGATSKEEKPKGEAKDERRTDGPKPEKGP